MGKITIEYEGELRTRAKYLHTDNEIITDAPLDNHGKGETFSPTDLVTTALGSCILTIMGIAAEQRDIKIEGARAEVFKFMGESPRRISEIHIHIYFKTDFTQIQRKILEKAAHSCPVHKSLHSDLKKKVVFHYT